MPRRVYGLARQSGCGIIYKKGGISIYRILIVEDETTIASLLCETLEKWGFGAKCAVNFSDITGEVRDYQPQLVVMDISLPSYNGYYWCTEIRKSSKVPIVFLSSHSENMDIVMAMSCGGDDYITKPFSTDVAVAKINAVLRRAYSYYDAPQTLSAGAAVLDAGRATVSCGAESCELSKNELRIMQLLMEHKNTPVTREEIMKRLWDDESFVDDNTLTVNINRLRRRLAGIGLENFIVTRKGEGYAVYD